jgi:hypothetical protein
MMEPAAAGQPAPRAFLRVGGATLARHQLGIALALECQRVVCVAREVSPEVIALQHEAERAGVRLHVISGPRALAALVTANDELIVFTEGLLAAPQEVIALLEGGHAVLVQPIESGLAAGFERIDINHAAAGAMRIPGRLVEGLADLPADVDIPSALTRIALQAGIAMEPVPASAREGVRWKLVRDEVEAHAIESAWIRLHMGEGALPTPGIMLARLSVLTLGPSLLHAGSGWRLAAAGAVATMLLALGAGWFGYGAVALALGAIAWTIRRAAGLLERVERDSMSLRRSAISSGQVLGLLLDLEIIALVVWSASPPPWDSLLTRVFPPFMLLCLVRLLPRVLLRGWIAWLEDRALLALLLAIAAAVGVLAPAVQVLAALLTVAALVLADGRVQITRV